MKIFLIIVMLAVCSAAHADQVVALCTQSQNGPFTNCVPVSTSAPLPVIIGH